MLYVVFLRLPFVMPEDGLAEVIMDQAEKLKGFVTIVSALPYKAVVALVGSTIAFGSTIGAVLKTVLTELQRRISELEEAVKELNVIFLLVVLLVLVLLFIVQKIAASELASTKEAFEKDIGHLSSLISIQKEAFAVQLVSTKEAFAAQLVSAKEAFEKELASNKELFGKDIGHLDWKMSTYKEAGAAQLVSAKEAFEKELASNKELFGKDIGQLAWSVSTNNEQIVLLKKLTKKKQAQSGDDDSPKIKPAKGLGSNLLSLGTISLR